LPTQVAPEQKVPIPNPFSSRDLSIVQLQSGNAWVIWDDPWKKGIL